MNTVKIRQKNRQILLTELSVQIGGCLMDYDKKIWEAIDKEAEEILQELDEAMKKNPVLRTIEASKSLDERVRAMIPRCE